MTVGQLRYSYGGNCIFAPFCQCWDSSSLSTWALPTPLSPQLCVLTEMLFKVFRTLEFPMMVTKSHRALTRKGRTSSRLALGTATQHRSNGTYRSCAGRYPSDAPCLVRTAGNWAVAPHSLLPPDVFRLLPIPQPPATCQPVQLLPGYASVYRLGKGQCYRTQLHMLPKAGVGNKLEEKGVSAEVCVER